MRTKLAVGFLALALTGLAAARTCFALGPVTVGLEVDHVSRYVWRGYDLVEDNRPAVQPSGTVTWEPAENLSLFADVWASYGVSEPDSGNQWDEIDYTLGLEYALSEGISLSLGHVFYHFPPLGGDSEGNDTQEVYAGVDAGCPHGLFASLYLYYDYDDGDGLYANLGVGYERDLAEGVSASLGADVGYMSYRRDADDGGFYLDLDGDGFRGFSDANFKLGVSADLGYGLTLAETLTYTLPLDDAINGADREVWTLTALSAAF